MSDSNEPIDRLHNDQIEEILEKLEKGAPPVDGLKEYRVFGPPGTGKTSYLKKQTAIAVEKYGSDQVIVASYTRAAAATLVHRDLGVDRDAIGTLHALCYRDLGSPEIAERHIDEFNERFPQFRLSNNIKGSLEDINESSGVTDSDRMFTEYRLQRARMMPLEKLLPVTIDFLKAWETWKGDNKYIDFTDMIDYTLKYRQPPPGNRMIGIYDEAQDFNRLEMALVRMWAQHQESIILAGDDDQSLFGFCGGDADAFLSPPIHQSRKRILTQSWRIPSAVHSIAKNWIEQLKNREPKEYKPRDFEGELRRDRKLGLASPARLLDDARRYLQEGKTVMFLASCGYMLDRLKNYLREQGEPFWNPYKKNRGDWNPLGNFGRNRHDGIVSSKDRLLSFLDTTGPIIDGKMYWQILHLSHWIDCIKTTGILKRGAKAMIEQQAEFPTFYAPEEIAKFHHECFEEHALAAALERDVKWFGRNLTSTKAITLDFPIKVCEQQGFEALNKKPQIILSTIHGVKGGEADACYVFPDMSLQGLREWQGKGEGHDAIVRMFYVAMTRAKESLVLCDPATPLYVKL